MVVAFDLSAIASIGSAVALRSSGWSRRPPSRARRDRCPAAHPRPGPRDDGITLLTFIFTTLIQEPASVLTLWASSLSASGWTWRGRACGGSRRPGRLAAEPQPALASGRPARIVRYRRVATGDPRSRWWRRVARTCRARSTTRPSARRSAPRRLPQPPRQPGRRPDRERRGWQHQDVAHRDPGSDHKGRAGGRDQAVDPRRFVSASIACTSWRPGSSGRMAGTTQSAAGAPYRRASSRPSTPIDDRRQRRDAGMQLAERERRRPVQQPAERLRRRPPGRRRVAAPRAGPRRTRRPPATRRPRSPAPSPPRRRSGCAASRRPWRPARGSSPSPRPPPRRGGGLRPVGRSPRRPIRR